MSRGKIASRGKIVSKTLMPTIAAICVIVIVAVTAVVAFFIWNGLQRSERNACMVEDKEAVQNGDQNQYRVYTDNCGVLTVEDSVFLRRWNSADIYHSLKLGTAYDVQLQGGRYPVFSIFPNVIEATPTNGSNE